MEIQCPSCQKKLSIGDQFAGQLVKCPACNGVFMAPTLAMPQAPMAAPVPQNSAARAAMPMAQPLGAPAQAAAPDVIPFSSEPPPRPPSPYPPPAPPQVLLEDAPPAPPGDYVTSHTLHLCPEILRWVAPVALAVIFVLSFFPWIVSLTGVLPTVANLWEIAFGDRGSAAWILYLLLTLFLALPLAWAKLLMEIELVPALDFLKPVWSWRSVAVGGLLALTLTFATLGWWRQSAFDSTTVSFGVGLRLHLIALIACGLEFWLVHRKKKGLPLPELTVRW